MVSGRNTVDLNSDVGERASALLDGSEEQLLRLVSSANIACGGHAGNAASMKAVVTMCLACGVSIGAHPGFPDRARFGRTKIDIPASKLEASVREQVESLLDISAGVGAIVRHVKPHGALYNAASKDRWFAEIIANAISSVNRNLVLVGLVGSPMLDVWRSAGFTVVGEAFADRRYEPDGTLRSRSLGGALITNPEDAATQAGGIVCDGVVVAVDGSRLTVQAQTICIHSDTENAIALASRIRTHLLGAGVTIEPF
ncbi:LamB/YcsF family protein [bacterium]|nr:MAG: LamB/YcsF family protein [bacterium]